MDGCGNGIQYLMYCDARFNEQMCYCLSVILYEICISWSDDRVQM